MFLAPHFLVLRCQCSPPANVTSEILQKLNQTGYSPDSIQWSSLNVSVRPEHSDLWYDVWKSRPHSVV